MMIRCRRDDDAACAIRRRNKLESQASIRGNAGRNVKSATPAPSSIRPCRLLKAVVERVARAAHGANRVDLGIPIERPAQSADMDVNGALVDIDVTPPHAIEQLLAREHTTGPLHQIFEQPVFGRTELDRPAGARYASLLPVHFEVAEAQDIG